MVFYLGVDQGTTNTKVVLFNGKKIITKSIKKIPIIFTKEGWVEQDPDLMIKNIIYWSIKSKQNVFKSIKH